MEFTADRPACDRPASRADAVRPHPLNRRRWLALPFLALAGRSLATSATASPVRPTKDRATPPAREPFPVIESGADDPLALAADDLHDLLRAEQYWTGEQERFRQAGDMAEADRLDLDIRDFQEDREQAEADLFALLEARPGLEIEVAGLTRQSGFLYHAGSSRVPGATVVRVAFVARLVAVEPEGGV